MVKTQYIVLKEILIPYNAPKSLCQQGNFHAKSFLMQDNSKLDKYIQQSNYLNMGHSAHLYPSPFRSALNDLDNYVICQSIVDILSYSAL